MLRTPYNGVLFSRWHWREQIIYIDGNQGNKAWSCNGNSNEGIKILNEWQWGKPIFFLWQWGNCYRFWWQWGNSLFSIPASCNLNKIGRNESLENKEALISSTSTRDNEKAWRVSFAKLSSELQRTTIESSSPPVLAPQRWNDKNSHHRQLETGGDMLPTDGD